VVRVNVRDYGEWGKVLARVNCGMRDFFLILILSPMLFLSKSAGAEEGVTGPFICASDPGVVICQVAVPSTTVTDAKLNRGACVSPLETFSIYRNELKSMGREIGDFKDFRGTYKLGDKFALYVTRCSPFELTISADGQDHLIKLK